MSAKDDLVLTQDEISRNPGVDPDIVREALRMREKLESMGVWVDKGSRIVNPFGIHPDRPPAQQQPMPSGLAQLQPPRR